MPLLNITVYGLSGRTLERFFARESSRNAQPLVATSAAELRFGLTAAAASMGAWGKTWPVVLQRCSCRNTPCVHVPRVLSPSTSCNSHERTVPEHYVAQVHLTEQEIAALEKLPKEEAGDEVDSLLQTEQCLLPCRLVIVEEAFFRVPLTPESRICATPGTVIAGVDRLHTFPSVLHVSPTSKEQEASLWSLGGEVPQWLAVLDVRSPSCEACLKERQSDSSSSCEGNEMTVCFDSTGEQFAALHNLPALPPRPMPSMLAATLSASNGMPSPASPADTVISLSLTEDGALPPFCECGPKDIDGADAHIPGPLLSLTFYGNDPARPYDQTAWQSELTVRQSEVVHRLARDTHDGAPVTTLCRVTDVRPIPVEGSCWCPSDLPVPAPLEQQLRERRSKRNPASSTSITAQGNNNGGSTLTSPVSSVSTVSYSSRHHTRRENMRRSGRCVTAHPSSGFLAKGWCVRPLQMIKPVLPEVDNAESLENTHLVTARSQHSWTCLLNLRELDEFGIEVTVAVPQISGGVEFSLKGNTVLFSGMLKSSTSGTLMLPVHCPAPADAPEGINSLWMKLYVQYLLVFPMEAKTLEGPLQIVRSVDNQRRLTVPTLIGHRGLGKTVTRAPAVVTGDPLIVKCSENTVSAFQAAHARKCAMVEFDVMLSADRIPVVIHDPLIELMALKREAVWTSPEHAEYTLVRAAVHKLNWAQLRDLHSQCCKTLGRVAPIKDLLMHHWEGLISWARNRPPKKLAQTLSLQTRNHGKPGGSVRGVESALMRVEDFPNGVPSLREVLQQTPPSLGFNIEVKYPFQPRSDSNLFLQSDAFEVNGFVDAILQVVFEFAEDGRDIVFSSFDPNICLALSLKQSRYNVFFLSDTKELRDLKDYRSFYVEGAIQFATAQHLAGVSMNAGTLLSQADEAALLDIPESPLYGSSEHGPVAASFFRPESTHPEPMKAPSSFGTFGQAIIAEMHCRGLKVWTWGSMNNYLYFTHAQVTKMQVDGVIGDRIPVFSSAA